MSSTAIIAGTFALLAYLLSIWSNYYAARYTGLRLIVSPITPYTLQWKIASALFRPLLVRFKWFRAIDWTCCWQDGDALHRELGLSFIVVSPGCNVLCTSDGQTIEHVFKKWREFVKPDNVNGELSCLRYEDLGVGWLISECRDTWYVWAECRYGEFDCDFLFILSFFYTC
jgi:hypothetical protein